MSGIRTLEDLRERCRMIDGCWVWGHGLTHDGQPKIHAVIDGQCVSTTGGRVAWLLAGGKIPAKHVVYRPICETLCLNPAHLRCGPKAQAGKALVATGKLRGNPLRSLINHRNRCSKKVLLNLTKAREIRASDESAAVLAVRYGTSATTINDVLRMKRWKEPGWSVFSQLAA